MSYPKELYLKDHYRVVHSQEEYDSAKSDGWSDSKAPDSKYIPESAIGAVDPPLLKAKTPVAEPEHKAAKTTEPEPEKAAKKA